MSVIGEMLTKHTYLVGSIKKIRTALDAASDNDLRDFVDSMRNKKP